MIPLVAFLLCAFSAAPSAVPLDKCDLWITATEDGGWDPSCHGECTPGGCPDPTKVEGDDGIRWWCDCNGVRGGKDVECIAVLIYAKNYPLNPWVARCYQGTCTDECVDFPAFPDELGSFILCPCF
ncbi:MAG: hypothetical protein KDE27_24790 [Planctomycetes bacterium]|nr:hypothetical protein [Planctomycetota bacterium]